MDFAQRVWTGDIFRPSLGSASGERGVRSQIILMGAGAKHAQEI